MLSCFELIKGDESGWDNPTIENVKYKYRGSVSLGRLRGSSYYTAIKPYGGAYSCKLNGKEVYSAERFRLSFNLGEFKQRLLATPEGAIELARLRKWHDFVKVLLEEKMIRFTIASGKRPVHLPKEILSERNGIIAFAGSQERLSEMLANYYKSREIEVALTCVKTGQVFSAKELFLERLRKADRWTLQDLVKNRITTIDAEDLRALLLKRYNR